MGINNYYGFDSNQQCLNSNKITCSIVVALIIECDMKNKLVMILSSYITYLTIEIKLASLNKSILKLNSKTSKKVFSVN